MAQTPESEHDLGKPISLRNDAPRTADPVPAAKSSSTVAYVVLTAAVFLLLGLLIATLISSGGDDSISKAELRDTVQEVVGTQIAAVQPVQANPGGSANQADIQAMIDQAVSTKVQALIPTNTPVPPTPTLIPDDVAEDGDPFRGPADAPVVIVEFSDFQCGYCGRFYEQTLPKILEKYPQEVKFVYRDFPIFGQASAEAAMATQCANEQGKFWDMHNRLFDNHASDAPKELNQDTLVSFAGEMGLDTDAFTTCLTSQRYLDEVLNDYKAAQEYGFSGTPGFVINGRTYVGAQPFEVFDQIIQQELALKTTDSAPSGS